MYCDNRRRGRWGRRHDGQKVFSGIEFSGFGKMVRMVCENQRRERVSTAVFPLNSIC